MAKANPKNRANKLNKEFDFAETKLKAGSEEIASQLFPMLFTLSGTYDIKEWKKGNQYFKLDESYNGNRYQLFQYIKFKEIPDNEDTLRYLKQIEKMPWMSEKQYNKFEKEWRNKSYKTLSKNKYLNDIDFENYYVLEQVMNSSPAWKLATRSALESDQVMERWKELYNVMSEAYNTDDGLFDWAYQQIMNGKRSLNWLINAIDDEIKLMKQGKYSHRRKQRN